MKDLFFHHPRRVWWRRLLFQVHLWVGLIATLYICLVGITGSILVFQTQLYRLSRPELFKPLQAVSPGLAPSATRYLEIAAKNFPQARVTGVYFPYRDRNVIQLEADARNPRFFNDYLEIYLDPISGRVLGTTDRNFWLAWIRELHVRLLAGRTGAIVNGCGAFCLLALSVSGIVIWWPGVKHWTRALGVDFKRRLRRINFDLHSAIGFWSLLFVSLWAVSGIYFTWPDQFVSAVDFFTPARSSLYPQIHLAPASSREQADLQIMLRQVQAFGGMPLLSIELPVDAASALVITTDAGTGLDRSTYFFFNPNSGKLLAIWQRTTGGTLGAQFVYWLGPLHFGESWGIVIQIVWCLFGLALPILAITGGFMYWNRYLGKRIRQKQTLNLLAAEVRQ